MSSIFGFLLGSVLSGSGLYFYVIDEYKLSNQLLTEDIYVSHPFSIQCLHSILWFFQARAHARPEASRS